MCKRSIILPVMLILCAAFISGAAFAPVYQVAESELSKLEAEATRIGNLPVGSPISLVLTDVSLTQAAREGVSQYQAEIQSVIKQLVNADVKVSDPKVEFKAEGFRLSAKAGVSFLKLTAAVSGVVTLVDGKPEITVQKVDLPLMKISPEQATSQLKSIMDAFAPELLRFVTLSRLEITDGQLLVEGTKN